MTRTILTKHAPSPELLSAMADFRDIVNHMISYGAHFKTGSAFDLRDACRPWFDAHYPYAKHWCGSAATFAMGVLRSWRETGGNVPHLRRPILHLDEETFRLRDGSIRITVRPREWVEVPLKMRPHTFTGKVSEVTLTVENVCLAYQDGPVAMSPLLELVGVDSNFARVVGATESGEFVEADISGSQRAHSRFSSQRRRVQSSVRDGNRKSRLLARSGARERDVSKDAIRKAMKSFTSNQWRAYAQEDLRSTTKGCLARTRGKGRRRALSAWCHGLVHDAVAKSPSIDVRARGTSKYCAWCGTQLDFRSGYHTPTCPNHGVLDRDRNAAVNVLRRGLESLGRAPFPPAVSASLLEQSVLRRKPGRENRCEAVKGDAGSECADEGPPDGVHLSTRI